MKKCFRRLVNLISVLVIAAALYMLFTVVMTRQGEAPSILGYSVFRVMTGSMEPELREDALIVVKKTDPSQIRTNDIISFYSTDPELNGAVNTHRVTEVEHLENDYQFTTKGDANALPDRYPAEGNRLLGKVIFVSYPLGIVVKFLSGPLGFVLLILCPLAVILISSLCRAISSARKIMKEEEEAAVREAIEAVRRKKQQEKAGKE